MFGKLEMLKQKGYYPDTILDIGAYHGKWTESMCKIYDKSQYYLFEAIDYPELKKFKNTFNVLLSDKIEDVNWYEMKNTGDSMFREKTGYFKNCDIKKRRTVDLNTVIEEYSILQNSQSILIKIDCQGAEIPILKGATSIYAKTDFIILEMPLFGQYNEGVPSFLEHITFMDTIGFVSFDVLDVHYANGFAMQVDFLFVRATHEFNAVARQAFF
jgi:FkbM family methyltransferase